MIADVPIAPAPARPEQPTRLWCYIVSLRGALYAIPDSEEAVLLPHINRLATVTPLPRGLVRPYVLGLINVAQRGEVAIDLAALLGLGGDSPTPDQRCVLVIGESLYDPQTQAERRDPYRLAYVVDAGYELAQVEQGHTTTGANSYVTGLVYTRHGEAALLDMRAVCASVISELGAERPWNAAE